MKNILTILKKELKRFFTDRRMLVGVFLPGILIYVLYSVLGGIMPSIINPEIEEINVCIENEPTQFEAFLEDEEYTINEIDNLSKQEAIDKIKDGELHMYVIYPDNFFDKMLAYSPESGKAAPNVEIYYNSADNASLYMYQNYVTYLSSYEMAITNKFDINNSSDTYDLASNEDATKQIFSMLLPFILTMFLFSGAMSICSDSISGEKERGTIATLLVTPVNRSHIVIGKIASLGIMSLASALVSFLGLILSLPKLVGSDVSMSVYGFDTIVLMLFVVLVTVLLFSSILTIISTYAKSVKEATSLSTPLMLIVTMLGMTGMYASSVPSNPLVYLIPVYNSIQCFSGILNLTINPACFIVTIVSNIAYVGLAVYGLTKMFNSERIMFNK